MSNEGDIAGFLDVGLRQWNSSEKEFTPCTAEDLKPALEIPPEVCVCVCVCVFVCVCV